MAKVTLEKFLSNLEELKELFTKELESILEGEEGLDDPNAEDDIFSGGAASVDSKAVVQLNPIAENELKIKLDPEEWITPGGFGTVDEAVSSLIEAIKKVLEK